MHTLLLHGDCIERRIAPKTALLAYRNRIKRVCAKRTNVEHVEIDSGSYSSPFSGKTYTVDMFYACGNGEKEIERKKARLSLAQTHRRRDDGLTLAVDLGKSFRK